MTKKIHRIGIIEYPKSLRSAIYGMQDILIAANDACEELSHPSLFEIEIINTLQLSLRQFDIVLLPPSYHGDYYLTPSLEVTTWLKQQHKQGAILAASCAGVFLLASSQLLENKSVTTHWRLKELFKQHHPTIHLNTQEIVINQGDIISAGGMMAWLDLSLEIVRISTSEKVMHLLGKILVVDTGKREQRFYEQFCPNTSHNDETILLIQHELQQQFSTHLNLNDLARQFHLTLRTMQRRFLKATGMNPKAYLQRVRIQRVCDLLENTTHSFDRIVTQVGYDDTNACRKIFIKHMGLTPSQFRQRFSSKD